MYFAVFPPAGYLLTINLYLCPPLPLYPLICHSDVCPSRRHLFPCRFHLAFFLVSSPVHCSSLLLLLLLHLQHTHTPWRFVLLHPKPNFCNHMPTHIAQECENKEKSVRPQAKGSDDKKGKTYKMPGHWTICNNGMGITIPGKPHFSFGALSCMTR